MVDVQRVVLHYTSRLVQCLFYFSIVLSSNIIYMCPCLANRAVLRRIVGVCGTFGLVTPREKTCLLHPVVGRFNTGDTIRVVQPAEVIGQAPWELENNKSCGLKVTYDLPHGKTLGYMAVRVCWNTAVYRDEYGYVETHFLY
jgi:hypothetical protein